MAQHVAILYGGPSAEREVSLVSGKAVEKACRELGYKTTLIDAQIDLSEQLAKAKPDAVFNALHGRWGEDGCVQGLLELLKIPYTHSGVLASAVAMDKPMAKEIFVAAGLPVAQGRVFTKTDMLRGDPMPRPYVVKPSNEGSSVGVKIVQANDNFYFDAGNWSYGDEVLVESYIPGREITVAVLDDVALGVTEIRPLTGFYDYDNKYKDGKSAHLCPAPLPKDKYEEALVLALAAHRALGCRGLSRADFRYDDTEGDGRFYLLEVNTQPGMTPLSLSPEIAQHAGLSFNELVNRLIKGAKLGK